MRRDALALLAGLAAAAWLGGGIASADPPTAPATTTDQIGRPAAAKHDVGSEQIAPANPSAVGVGQLAPSAQPVTQSQLGHPAAGRNTHIAPVVGRDRCDPASPEAKSPECAHIPERHAADLPDTQTDATTNTVDPNASSGDLVNGILSSGTGSVVQLPPK